MPTEEAKHSFKIYVGLMGFPEDCDWWDHWISIGYSGPIYFSLQRERLFLENYNKFMEEDVNISGHKGAGGSDSSISESVPSSKAGITGR